MALSFEGPYRAANPASLRWGYAQAAVLGRWSVSGADGQLRLTAEIVRTDTMRVAQRPLVFEAPHAKGAWRWPVLELQMAEGSLTAILGAYEG